MTMHSDHSMGGPAHSADVAHTMHSEPADAAVPEGSGVPEVPAGLGIEVDPRRVREAADLVEDQVRALNTKLAGEAPALTITPPAQDQVSVHVAEAWNAAVVDGEDGYLARSKEYLRGLQLLAVQLRAAADQYESDDSESEISFTGGTN